MLLIENNKEKMIVRINIAMYVLYVWLSVGGYVAPSNDTIHVPDFLPDLIRKFCPKSNVCPEHTGISAPSTIPWLTSCCTACSCAADCKERNDCCFPKLTVNNDVIENSVMTITRCLWATTIETSDIITPQSNSDDRITDLPINSYNMITDVPGNQGTVCGDVTVAVWGSMYPVYSKKTKLMYKNTACAEAYGVTDGMVWNSYVSCNLFSYVNGTYALSTHFMSGFDNKALSRDCNVYFEYPGEKKDMEPHICYNDVIESCPDQEFSLNDGNVLNISMQMVREACYSGLFSPFITVEIYANVFCSMCNGHPWFKHIDCRDTDDKSNRFNKDGFVGLINSAVISTALEKTSEMPNVCPDSGDVDVACRPLQCPSSQIRLHSGDCDQLFRSWYIKPIGVHLSLTSNVGFNITGLLPSSRALQEFTSLSNPWLSPWKIVSLSYESFAADNSSQISVILQNDKPSSNPHLILRNIMRNIKKPWFLFVGPSKRVILQSTFSKFLSMYHTQMDVDIIDSQQQLVTRFFNVNKDKMYAHAPAFIINKLYTCNHVELEPSEFVLHYGNSILYNKIARSYHFNGEFALSNEKDGVRANICLEGSGFVQVSGRPVPKTITVIACCILGMLMHGVVEF